MSEEITSKDGLLWKNGQVIPVSEADAIAKENGYQYAEQLVKALKEKQDQPQ